MTHSELIENQRKNLLIFAERHGISKACKIFGVSRTTYYKLKKQLIDTGSLAPKKRRKPRMPNEISLSKKKLLLELVQEYPNWGPLRYALALKQKGVFLAPSCVWYHLKRFDLNKRFKRLVYLEQLKLKKQPLTERSLHLVKTKCHSVKHGLWPGHIVAIDTFYIGNLKGIGRIYQISGIDLCSRFGWANIYTDKTQKASMDFVESMIIPSFFHNNIDIEAILSDNGSEFIGKDFKQMLADYDIIQHHIPKGKPIYNGYCERFQRTIYEEFYQHIFRTKIFKTLDQLKNDLKKYLFFYNFERAHFGISKSGHIPAEVFHPKRSFLQQRFQKLLT